MSPQERLQRLAGVQTARSRANAALRRYRALERAFWVDVVATTPECARGRHDSEHLGDDFYRCRVCGRETG